MDAVLQALAEPHRRAILKLVWDRELTAGDIAQQFRVSRPAISQHLAVLREAELVSVRQESTRRYYRAQQAKLAELRRYLEEYWTGSLDRLKATIEADLKQGRP